MSALDKGDTMNIDDMKVGDVKQLAALFGGQPAASTAPWRIGAWGDDYFYGGVHGQNISTLQWKQIAPPAGDRP